MSTSTLEISARLQSARADSQMSRGEIKDVTGVSDATWRRYENGDTNMSAMALARFCQRYGYSLDWLLTGQGPMKREPDWQLLVSMFMGYWHSFEPEVSQPVALKRFVTEYNDGKLERAPGIPQVGEDELVRAMAAQDDKPMAVSATQPATGLVDTAVTSTDYIQVPHHEVEASCGGGSIVHSEQIVDYLAFKRDWLVRKMRLDPNKVALISAMGDSMEPRISPGDLLLLDLQVSTVVGDGIYALLLDGHLYVKRIQRLFDGTVIISSENPAYEPQRFAPDSEIQLQVVGRVAWVGRMA